jgi:hypothetical protein
MLRRLSVFAMLLGLAACGNLPDREMDVAQGAIDAARAADAARYAPAEFEAATTALVSATEAVTQRDYRLALSQALEASEHAQAAARLAVDQKAVVRSDVEHALVDLDAAIADARTRLETAGGARSAAAPATVLRASLTAASSAVQEARSALEREDYLAAREALDGAGARLGAAVGTFDRAIGFRRHR